MNVITRKEKKTLKVESEKAERAKKKSIKNALYDNFDNVITYLHYYDALRKCLKGVRWKNSVQKYHMDAVLEIHRAITIIRNGSLPPFTSNRKIVIYERGKQREIVPVTIRDRMTQRVLCDDALIPVIKDTLIFDNGASTKGKGVDFTRQRLDKHLKAAIKEYGTDFYVLKFDFKSYFDSIPHKTCYEVLKKYFQDTRIVNIVMDIIKSYHISDINHIENSVEREREFERLENLERCGICLGSQISQIMALVVPNELDHFIKDVMRVKHYVRYMDDGIIFSNDKEFLIDLLKQMMAIADKLGLRFNVKKTQITKISKGFTFLKIRYIVTKNGKIIRNLTRQGITRMRRKLKKFRILVDDGKMTLDNVYDSMQSWLAHAKITNSYKTVHNMLKLYDELFDGYKITAKYYGESKTGHRFSEVYKRKAKKNRKQNSCKGG